MTYPTFSLQGPSTNLLKAQIAITGSKSETNRLLLLQALFPVLSIDNLSNSEDAQAMQRGVASSQGTVDIYHAGTAMRFLTAYYATQPDVSVTLTGSERMQERPIGILVDALRNLGANISYLKNEGYPPLAIKGSEIAREKVQLNAGVSSQYISALLLVGARLKNGLTLELEGKITSVPYIKMTLKLLEKIGVKTMFEGQEIKVFPAGNVLSQTMVVESDWSSASYYYSLIALSDVGSEVSLSSYSSDSLQGDAVLCDIYSHLGVQTTFKKDQLVLAKVAAPHDAILENGLSWDLANAPDIAQTIAVSCFALGVACDLTGLHTLKIKETDRLLALESELGKLGAGLHVTEKSLHLKAFDGSIKPHVTIGTYHDHRMAMAFAPLALRVPIAIEDAGVVNKSYPDFWTDMNTLGIQVAPV
ncbi:3-phosphoshikimate 1-carboxyvinyltransferase [Flavobacteriaceae bacterium]|nr:3-phosphoshikimate 1-carboxyvinyltransferase [Flavobacteriaceae bacterium]